VNNHSIELPNLSSKDYLFFAIHALAYVALGIWVGMAPQSIPQPELNTRTQSPAIYSQDKKLQEPSEIIASDLKSTPAILDSHMHYTATARQNEQINQRIAIDKTEYCDEHFERGIPCMKFTNCTEFTNCIEFANFSRVQPEHLHHE